MARALWMRLDSRLRGNDSMWCGEGFVVAHEPSRFNVTGDLSRRNQYPGARASRFSQWRVGAVGPLGEAGTHRSNSGDCRLSAVGVAVLRGGEDVKAG